MGADKIQSSKNNNANNRDAWIARASQKDNESENVFYKHCIQELTKILIVFKNKNRLSEIASNPKKISAVIDKALENVLNKTKNSLKKETLSAIKSKLHKEIPGIIKNITINTHSIDLRPFFVLTQEQLSGRERLLNIARSSAHPPDTGTTITAKPPTGTTVNTNYPEGKLMEHMRRITSAKSTAAAVDATTAIESTALETVKKQGGNRFLNILRSLLSRLGVGGTNILGFLSVLGSSAMLVNALGKNSYSQETSEEFYEKLNDKDYKNAFPKELSGKAIYSKAWTLCSKIYTSEKTLESAMQNPNIYQPLSIFALDYAVSAKGNKFDKFSPKQQKEIIETYLNLAKTYHLKTVIDRFSVDEYLDIYKWYCQLNDKTFKDKYSFRKLMEYYINIPDNIYKTISFEDKPKTILRRKYFWIKYNKESAKNPFNEYDTIEGIIQEIIKDRKTDYTRG